MEEEKLDIAFGSKEEYVKAGGQGGTTTHRRETWRASIRHLLTDSDVVAHYTLRGDDDVDSIKSAISSAGKLEGVDNRLQISSNTRGNAQAAVVSYWIEPGIDLPEETPEQVAVDTSPGPAAQP